MGELLGVQVQPRDIAALAYGAGWHDVYVLARACAICLSESDGFDRAFNDNLNAAGTVISRDVGLWQINIPASQIGTVVEEDLYDHHNNVVAARALYEARGFEPWVSYTTGVYLHDTYYGRAALGVFNSVVADANAHGATLPLPIFSTHDLAAKLT